MTALERLLPAPRMLEIDRVDLAAPPARVWELIRHGDLSRSPLVNALFAIRTLPSRIAGKTQETEPVGFRIDSLGSSKEKPSFQILAEDPPHEVAVGAIGKVWHLDIPFVHVDDADAFAKFAEPGFIKVAWAIRLSPLGEHATHLEFELRVDATDRESWPKFQRYFRMIGPGSHFIRRSVMAAFAREFGTAPAKENEIALAGDNLLSDAGTAFTHFVDIAATPDEIWPWLVQIGCRRGGFYSIDLFDNAGRRSAREIHPELQNLRVGQVIPATPKGNDGFEVLLIDPARALVLGGLYDSAAERQLRFADPRPDRFWQVTWSFVLEPLDERSTRLYVRARAAYPLRGLLHVAAIRPVHHLMQTAELRHLAARAEGRLPRDDWHDYVEGAGGALRMLASFATPFLRERRRHWGLDAETAARRLPGDDLVSEPLWDWTHGIEIDATPECIWPFVAQIGADKGGFYSYQWLENLVGCEVKNAEVAHPEWEAERGSSLKLHPDFPPLEVVSVERGRYLVAHAARQISEKDPEKPWIEASWLLYVEPIGGGRSRFISRYRAACSEDLKTRISFGPTLVEPVSFAMDRRMLLGLKERVEASLKHADLN